MQRLWFVLAFSLLPLAGIAQTYPEPISPYVNDFAKLLDADDIRDVRAMLIALKSDTGIQMTVVTLGSQTPYAPNETLDTFATNLFNNWGIGDATHNDGILVLVLPDDRVMRIELGAGFDKQWDNEAGRVIDRSYLPSFRSDNYARGIKDGVADTIATLARPFANGQPPKRSTSGTWLIVLAFAGFVLFAVRRRIEGISTKLRRCPSCHKRGGLNISRKTKIEASPVSKGSGLKTVTCEQCNYFHSTSYLINQSTTTGGSGFGGGRSSGGGASGRW